MRKTILCAIALACGTLAHAQSGITGDVLKTLEGSYNTSPTEKALRNAMGGTSIQKLTLNQDNRQTKDTHQRPAEQRQMLALYGHQRAAQPRHAHIGSE